MKFNININWNIVLAIFKRDVRRYFTNPTGYVFITLFIFLSAASAFWQERFFSNNLANLDQLNYLFPFLLLFFVPALTMGVWADEKKQGTDELLLTIPATDFEVVLGKYFAALAIYTASLVLSLSHVFVLFWLGSPDLGLMFGNYLGYWLIGAAFISVGMLASLLTANVTIAFILGAIFCSFFVFINSAIFVFSKGLQEFLSPLGIAGYFGDFTRGVVSFSGLLYFGSIIGVMLYLNVILIGRRHWPLQADGAKMWVHYAARTLAIVIGVISLNAILAHANWRVDVTAEGLHTLSKQTKTLLKELPDDRPVYIQAYISPDVPQPLVQTRENLVSFLREIDAAAGNKVEVLIQDTQPYTPAAQEAREKFNIVPHEVLNPGSARASVAQVFMGVAFTCGPEEQVIPFFDRGLPVEYELVRSIRVVAKTGRKKVGVLNTAVKLFGGFDFNTMQSSPEWSVVQELKKQYEVVQVSAENPISQDVDALLVVLPSSLPQEEMDNVLAYVQNGSPTLFLVDPMPVINIGLAPSERAGSDRNPFMQNQGPPPKPKGNVMELLRKLGVGWNSRQIIWDAYNPHPDFATLPPEFVFVAKGNGNPETFNMQEPVSAGLQELILLYPGAVQKAAGSKADFEPLVKSSFTSGALMYSQLVRRSFFGSQIVSRGLRRIPNDLDYTFAAWVKSKETPATTDSTSATHSDAGDTKINLIVISDLDFISEQFFEIRKRGIGNLNFDNVTFFLNCIDALTGDESFVALRNRRVKYRTLERVEAQTRKYIEQRTREQQEAETEAQKALAEAQQRLNEKVDQVRQRPDLDEQTKQIMVRNLQEVENRRLDAVKKSIEAEKEAKLQRSKEHMESQIRRIQTNIKTFAVVIPPIPVLIIGIYIFIRRRRREREGALAARRLRD